MARRGSKGGRSGDIQARLGSLFQTALNQLGSVREAVTQQAKEGKTQLDLALLRRRRKSALAELGAVVARLAADGRLDEDDFPELSGPLSRLEAIDEQMSSTQRGGPAPSDEEFATWRRQADAADDTDDEDADDEEYMRSNPDADSDSDADSEPDDDARYRPRDEDDDDKPT